MSYLDVRGTGRERWYRLLGILQEHAPTGSDQTTCAKMVWDMQRHGENDFQIERTLANALADGLNHNNWPWSPKTVTEATGQAKCPTCTSDHKPLMYAVPDSNGDNVVCWDTWHKEMA